MRNLICLVTQLRNVVGMIIRKENHFE